MSLTRRELLALAALPGCAALPTAAEDRPLG
jgi:hypothetical protein